MNSSDLNAVSCTSATVCTAVGSFEYNSNGDTRAIVGSWNGTSWSLVQLPSGVPAGATSQSLEGISCASATTCEAVGSYSNGAGSVATFAESLSGGWSFKATPDPTGSSSSNLRGISCKSMQACTAVGSYVNAGGATETLAEVWNGSSWSLQTTPDPAGGGKVLNSVSCLSASICGAVGSYAASAGVTVTLAESEA